jgi:hypothetical protein
MPFAEERHLKVYIAEKTGEVNIEGNASGLRHFAEVCLSLIGKPPGPNHCHFSEVFFNSDPGSVDLIVTYSQKMELPLENNSENPK